MIDELNRARLPYALCGGLAMAVHGSVRATIDIDLLIPPESSDAVQEACRRQGFVVEALPMSLSRGKVPIERLTKVDSSGSLLSIDLLLVTEATRDAWESRIEAELRNMPLFVVSREGLISLKRLRGNMQDLADIERLEALDED